MMTTLIVLAVLAAIILTRGRAFVTWNRPWGHITIETPRQIILIPSPSWGAQPWGWYAQFTWLSVRIVVQRLAPQFVVAEREKKLEQIVRRTRNRAKADRRAS